MVGPHCPIFTESMARNSCEPNSTFTVEINHGPCPHPKAVCFWREISSTPGERAALLEETAAFIGTRLIEDETELFRARLSIDEGIQNAFSHGNGKDPAKRISLAVFEDEAAWGVLIGDEGSGFSADEVDDPTSPSGLWRENGRGLMIMAHYMDSVSYFDNGRTLRLLRKKRKKGAPEDHEKDTDSHQ